MACGPCTQTSESPGSFPWASCNNGCCPCAGKHVPAWDTDDTWRVCVWEKQTEIVRPHGQDWGSVQPGTEKEKERKIHFAEIQNVLTSSDEGTTETSGQSVAGVTQKGVLDQTR